LAYAWVGLWSVAAEDCGKFFQRCVARGEQIMQAQPPAVQPEAPATESKKTAPKSIRPMSVFNAFGAVESYHIDLNVAGILPTQQELEALTERVEVLSREVEALAKQRQPE
jgi:hypothetical protein